MKNLLKVFAVVIVITMLAALAAGCSVKGKTYAYDSIKITRPTDAQYEFESDSVYEALFDKDVIFMNDGTFYVGDVYSGFYKEAGGKIYTGRTNNIDTDGEPAYYVSGSKLIVKKTLADKVYVEVTFVKK